MNRFIVGSGRSGTTLLRRLLMQYGDVFIPHETEFPAHAAHVLRRTQPGKDRSRELARVAQATAQRDWELDMTALESVFDTHPLTSASDVIDAFVAGLDRDGNTSEQWAIKTPVLLPYLEQMLEDIENIRAVIVVRDGRAVFNSYRKVHATAAKPFGPKSVLANALFWADAAARTAELESRPEIKAIRYEDLVDDPQHMCADVMDFLHIEPLTNPRTADTPLLERQAGKEHHLVNSAPSDVRAAAFRTELSDRDIKLFEHLSTPWLYHYGYASEAETQFPHVAALHRAARIFNDRRYSRRIRDLS